MFTLLGNALERHKHNVHSAQSNGQFNATSIRLDLHSFWSFIMFSFVFRFLRVESFDLRCKYHGKKWKTECHYPQKCPCLNGETENEREEKNYFHTGSLNHIHFSFLSDKQ